MKTNHGIIGFLILITLFFTASITLWTTSAYSALANPITISKVEYIIENIHPTFWGDKPDSSFPRLFYNFFIYINDFKNSINNVKEVGVEDPHGIYWVINLKKNTSYGYIGGYVRFYNTALSETGSVLAMKNIKVIIITKDGQKIEYPISLPEPGKIETSEKSYLFVETYRGKLQNNYVQALKLGKISSAAIVDKNQLVLDFSIDDSRVFNGRVVLYDKKMNYLGESRQFIIPFSKEILSTLNKGDNFFVDNQINHLTLNESQVAFEKGGKISKVKYINLWLTDGAQFADAENPDYFNYVSRSEIFEVDN